MSLKIGDIVPNFTAKDSHGEVFESKSVLGRKPLVIYFYPKDNTPGCTTEACSFRDQYEDFKDLGAEVIGISSDSVKSHQKFANKYQLPFLLLSDQDKKLRHLFGVRDNLFGLLPGRVTYIIDRNGVVIYIFDSMNASKHISKALQMIKELVL
ncbi:peroxiredoxin [Flavobacterium sp. Fl-77]|uniref:thioredoxin-dependent peroxiredoxin n=1 Tax=Flavobacterium flavipigmentatum TaxID=2893884 RepID=A0AAJ2VX42_9FLAO|nr:MULTISPECIES: peroxiredoxin [unclassified Flavobacterium]MDX6182269.1 peroxiredoxin [Flavobacterium sp. Fl-33]MDX6185818.1 peroxiredoxin [Flavobacterium sp. Fl-77]UFH38998.1 peroxiredoxin [Flavobacterium sp. F-70]